MKKTVAPHSPTFDSRRFPAALIVAVGFVALFGQKGGDARQGSGDALPHSHGFLLTGNYVVGSVDLDETTHPIVNGFSTAPISMSGVPADADIVAAYLFWETITLEADPSQAEGVKFRGFDVDINSVLTVKRSTAPLAGTTAPCWSSGVPLAMHMFRADVLRFLPMRLDANDEPTGKRLVNDPDLAAHGELPHTVTLPVTAGNSIPESAGATLMVVYRDPSEPLRKIVLYDGIFIKPALETPMQQTLKGFYQSAADPSAKITHIVASGQPNNNDKISFNNAPIAANPFVSGSASQRAWASPTVDVSSHMNPVAPGPGVGPYGETATTQVFHQPGVGGYDCLSWGAVIFSTAVADVDTDGLPDGIEDAAGGVLDPNGQPLPNLYAMGANSEERDIFVEFNAMRALPGTDYGSETAPYSLNPYVATETDEVGHLHMPTPEELKMLGDAYAARGIRPHFDVGDISAYHSLGSYVHDDWTDDYASPVADAYLVQVGARGGEEIVEASCDPSNPVCHFPDFPGTVTWKLGLQAHRDAPVREDGSELTIEQLTDPEAAGYYDWGSSAQRRRFDPERRGLFHYVLNAHARGRPKSLPCLRNGIPAPYDLNDGTACSLANPDFNPLQYHVPTSASGVADLPGGDVMVTLGLWDDFVGKPFVRASTTLHELGHNLGLTHGGLPILWGNKAASTATYFEPNCKPNYMSSMSYLFQVHGLVDSDDELRINYSETAYGALNETSTLHDVGLSPFQYQPTWYAPAGSVLASTLGVSPATRFCSGLSAGGAAGSMARVFASSVVGAFDWNGDTVLNEVPSQDVNFDGTLSGGATPLDGFDDWDNVRLDQIGGAPTGVLSGSADGLALFNDGLVLFNEGGLPLFFDGLALFNDGLVLFNEGQQQGLPLFFDGLVLFNEGLALFNDGLALFNDGLVLFNEGGLPLFFDGLVLFNEGQPQTLEQAKSQGLGRPTGVNLCIAGTPGCADASPNTADYHRVAVSFNPVPFGTVDYEVQRKRADQPDTAYRRAGSTPTNTFIDPTELVDGTAYTYRVRASNTEQIGPWSLEKTITAVNNAPLGVAGAGYEVKNKSTLTVQAPGLLADDADPDSPPAFRGRRAVLVSGPTAGTLTCGNSPGICANGSFKYTPPKGASFVGPVTFTYKADDGLSVDFPNTDPALPKLALSAFSNPVTVTINVSK